MLPKKIDYDGPYVFKGAPDRLHIVFASREAFLETPVKALWAREVANLRTLLALQRWVAVRRDLWEDWGRLAETDNRDAIVAHMEKLLAEQPIGEVMGTIVRRIDGDDRLISLGEMVFGAGGLRMEELYRHRFATAQARDRFLDWFHTGDNMQAAEELVHVGFCLGTDAVGRALDRIAVEMPKRAPAPDAWSLADGRRRKRAR